MHRSWLADWQLLLVERLTRMARLTTPGGGVLMLLVLQVKDVVPSFFLSSLVKLKAGCQQPVVAVPVLPPQDDPTLKEVLAMVH